MGKLSKEYIEYIYKNLTFAQRSDFAARAKKDYIVSGAVFCALFLIVSILCFIILRPQNVKEYCISHALALYSLLSAVAIAIFIIVKIKRSEEKLAKDYISRKYQDDSAGDIRFNIESHIAQSNANFDISKIVTLASGFWEQCYLIIDANQKLLMFKFNGHYSKIYNFEEVTGYEIYENKHSMVSGTAGMSMIGGAFFGLAGAIAGGNSSRSISDCVDELSLLIRLNDINLPQVKMNYIKQSLSKQSYKYSEIVNNLQEICSILEYVLNNKKLDEPLQINNTQQEKSQNNREQLIELLELKEMLNANLITQEEYDLKKKQILGL